MKVRKITRKPPIHSILQIAFGITGVQTNPDFLKMMKYARFYGVIPNFTLSGIDLTPELAREFAKVIGAVAVSCYQSDKSVCYDTVETFRSLGIKQTNIHLMLSNETLDFAREVMADYNNDERLRGMNAIVFLGVKPKGRAVGKFTPVRTEEFVKLITECMAAGIKIGFDSCSAPKYERAVELMGISDEQKRNLLVMSERCESFGMFSAYINVRGEFFPCSFAEGEPGWESGIDVAECSNFMRDVWFSDKLVKYRQMSIDRCRECLMFDING